MTQEEKKLGFGVTVKQDLPPLQFFRLIPVSNEVERQYISDYYTHEIDNPEGNTEEINYTFLNQGIHCVPLFQYRKLQAENEQLKAKLEKAVEALRFYGNHDVWVSEGIKGLGLQSKRRSVIESDVDFCGGKRARAALKEIVGDDYKKKGIE